MRISRLVLASVLYTLCLLGFATSPYPEVNATLWEWRYTHSIELPTAPQTPHPTPHTPAAGSGTGPTTPARSSTSRGYMTTPEELAIIKQKADQGMEPYKSALIGVLSWAEKNWDYKLDTHQECQNSDRPAWNDNTDGTPILYAKALAYHLTNDSRYAEEVKNILQRIMTEVVTIDLDARQCRLNFSWGTPELVTSADLIEDYWKTKICTGPISTLYIDTTVRSGNCKALFQNWLIKNPYYTVAYLAESSKGNQGAAATTALAYIADYLWDRPEVLLLHRHPPQINNGQDIAFTPAQAFTHANRLALERMNGYGVEYDSSSSCDYLSGPQQSSQWPPVKSQIAENGIIPEDARREEFCNIPRYNGDYQNYPQVHLSNNIQQCELMLRRGDRSCFDNVDNTDLPEYSFVGPDGETKTTHLKPGRGSIERAIRAIIVDSNTAWDHDEALEVAYRYYHHYSTLPDFDQWFDELDRRNQCHQDVCFGTLTHGFARCETPTLPPTVPPPGEAGSTPVPTATVGTPPQPTQPRQKGEASAIVETDPVPNGGDAADDPAIWVHPTDPGQSVIIGTDKKGGLAVYDLAGNQLQYLADGRMNNVDLRYSFPLGAESVALVTAGNRSDDSIAIYKVNPSTRQLENVAARTIQVQIDEPYGSCMYRSPMSGLYYLIVNDKDGNVEQWELFDSGRGTVDARLLRSFSVGSQTEGCVADDQFGHLYIGEEAVGIWKYGAEPGDGAARTQVDRTGSGGHLTADVEGLSLYYASDGTGYLIASSQGSDEFVVYRREGNNDYVATFEIVEGNGIDAVSHTDGIDVTNFPLGSAFPQGLLVVQDNRNDGGNQNYKLVPWQALATAVSPPLKIDTTWDPRNPAQRRTPTPTPTRAATPTAATSTPSPSPTEASTGTTPTSTATAHGCAYALYLPLIPRH